MHFVSVTIFNYSLVMEINKDPSKDPFVMHLPRYLGSLSLCSTLWHRHRWRTRHLEIEVISFCPNTYRYTNFPTHYCYLCFSHCHPASKLNISKFQGVLQRYYLSGIQNNKEHLCCRPKAVQTFLLSCQQNASFQPSNPPSCFSLHTWQL